MKKVVEGLTDVEIKELEVTILGLGRRLKLDGFPKETIPKGRSYKDIILDICYENNKRLTYYADTNNTIQCYPNKNRSQGDLFLLAKYYIPDITLKEFRQCIWDLLNEKKLATLYCNNIEKRIFYSDLDKYHGGEEFRIRDSNNCDEYGHRLILINDNNDNRDSKQEETIVHREEAYQYQSVFTARWDTSCRDEVAEEPEEGTIVFDQPDIQAQHTLSRRF
jgi:hypothetical protein